MERHSELAKNNPSEMNFDAENDLFSTIDVSALELDDTLRFHEFCVKVSQGLHRDRKQLLAAIPQSQVPSQASFNILCALLTKLPERWPVLDLIRCHNRLWRSLPEAVKGPQCGPQGFVVTKALELVKGSYGSLLDLLPVDSGDSAALIDPVSGQTLTHASLRRVVQTFSLPLFRSRRSKPVVAIALPNGPLLALSCLAVATYYTAAPLNPSAGHEELRTDLLHCGAKMLITSKADVVRLNLNNAEFQEAGIEVLLAELHTDMNLSFMKLDHSMPVKSLRPTPNHADDTAILLFTSGTSGNKKLVPVPMHSIVSGVAFVAESWGLTEHDRCLNMMPLNHVGGLIRNLFAPLLAGGAVVCCGGFDPNLFWDVVEDYSPTWYYASPSMHSMVLSAAKLRPEAVAKNRIRLVCNAAGGLLPSLAEELRQTFKSVVLPSYGMTECMPISTPPLDYQLDRPGTSGMSVGPEIAVFDGGSILLNPGQIGRIHVRGAPLFPGYLSRNGDLDTSTISSRGWFDTGDLGYLDQDGYLYITGRSKEVINRGGELIAPLEVEDAIVTAARQAASPIFGQVTQALAFSVPHDVLQEVVGVILVTPPGCPRADLRSIHKALKESLHKVKWPVFAVYMDALPTRNNKIVRIGISSRMNLSPLTDDIPLAACHFEAMCPLPNAPLKESIRNWPCVVDHEQISLAAAETTKTLQEKLWVHVCAGGQDGFPNLFVGPPTDSSALPSFDFPEEALKRLKRGLHHYLVPDEIKYFDGPLPMTAEGLVDVSVLHQSSMSEASKVLESLGGTEIKVATSFAKVLGCAAGTLTAEADFFELGGDSLKAGRLLAELRREFEVRLPIDLLFTNAQIRRLSTVIDEKTGPRSTPEPRTDPIQLVEGCTKTYSSTNPLLLFIQLLPLTVVYPARRALTWTIWMYAMTFTQSLSTNQSMLGRLFNLILSLAVARIVTKIVAPVVAILSKWVIIGRFREGVYPMWGFYHTQWWLVQKIIMVAGPGIFGANNATLVLYYRLLGAKIGRNVSIAKSATLGEYDLLEIGDNVTLDNCICRPFAAEVNTSMYLGKIHLGKNSSVGLCSVVAPGTSLPDDTCIGPNSSSWELKDASEENRNLSNSKVPKAHWILELCIVPVAMGIKFIGALPWMGGLVGLVQTQPSQSFDQLVAVFDWYASPHRLAFHYLAVILNVSVGPFMLFIAGLIIKKTVDVTLGRARPGPMRSRTQVQKFRASLVHAAMPCKRLHKLADMFGSHYEFTSMAVRAFGGKIGRRVYWPGTGPTIQDYDLLDIGDDVVFGSRSHLITSDGEGSDYVRIGSGAMVSDRVVLLPGVTLSEGTVMGSGALTRRNKVYPSNTTWVGSKHGEALCLTNRSANGPRREDMQEKPKFNFTNEDFNRVGREYSRAASVDSSGTMTPTCGRRQSSIASTQRLLARFGSFSDFSPFKSDVSGKDDDKQGNRGRPTTMVREVSGLSSTGDLPSTFTGSSTPFGRAFYEGNAPYRVYGLTTIATYSILITIFVAFYWNIAANTSIVIVARLINTHIPQINQLSYRPILIYLLMTLTISVLTTVLAVLAVALTIGAKWLLLGRRAAGSYDWDKSPYCQRWQLFLCFEKLRKHCYGGNGIVGLLTGTHYLVLYYRAMGARIGKDCALFAGGAPHLLFTEPDLLTLGDRVSVDDASVVAHINSRGHFTLNELKIGGGSVLRSGSRLLSGAVMKGNARLLEHTLVMAGDEVDEGTAWQGWPGEAI